MKAFKRRRRGGTVAEFESAEAHLLASLTSQVVELLRDRHGSGEADPDPLAAQLGLGGPSQPPEDPVLQRLLPDAYRAGSARDAESDAADFRRLTERSLTAIKVQNAETLLAGLIEGGLQPGLPEADDPPVEVELDGPEVQAWLKALTDVRLALAVRLGIESEEDARLIAHSDDEATVAMAEIYDWLGYVQESLVHSLG
ncbi:MAG TPA: DUF2017 domain-containing protein [Aeromicrobium sp.]|nr:DUF2017 domain-containing protein [Aeromicrobium sp.]